MGPVNPPFGLSFRPASKFAFPSRPGSQQPAAAHPGDGQADALDAYWEGAWHPGESPIPDPRHESPLSRKKLGEWALVLQSAGIAHAVRSAHGATYLTVANHQLMTAQQSIAAYEKENAAWPPRQVKEHVPFRASPVMALLFISLLAFFALVTGPARTAGSWVEHGRSVASLALSTEPWRAVTALTLHGDEAHVVGNVVVGSVFGSVLSRRLGYGGAALMAVLAGTAGNLLNAWWHLANGNGSHASIGASTAVFAIVGLLTATQLLASAEAHDREHVRQHGRAHGRAHKENGHATGAAPQRRWVQRFAPIAGGAALLGALGASPESDLGAHLFGFLAGIVLGGVVAWPLSRTWAQRHSAQILQLTTAVTVVVGAWQLSFYEGAFRAVLYNWS